MPTQPGIKGETLNPQQTLAKVSSLITELVDDEDGTPETADAPETSPAPTPPEASPQTSDTEPPASESPDQSTYEVRVDGESVVVDLDELKAGYSRDADYRKKTMKLADDRREFETESQQVQQERAQYQQGLGQLRAALEQLQGEPDWESLHKQLPPDEFLKRKADWEVSRAHLEKIKAHEQDVIQQAQQAQAQHYAKQLRTEQDKLRTAIPEWADGEKMKAEQTKLAATAKHYGFTEQEINSVTDHRTVLLLRDAMRYRELHRDAGPQTKAKVSAIRPARPGSPDRPRPNAVQEKLLEATKSGRQRDAMAAIASLIPD